MEIQEQLVKLILITGGVCQEGSLSPKLFIASLEGIFRNLDWKPKGIYTNRKCRWYYVGGKRRGQCQTMVEELNEYLKLVGLQINISKSKVVTNKTKIQIL